MEENMVSKLERELKNKIAASVYIDGKEEELVKKEMFDLVDSLMMFCRAEGMLEGLDFIHDELKDGIRALTKYRKLTPEKAIDIFYKD